MAKPQKGSHGLPLSWEYDRLKKQWFKLESGKAIGTPCESYLFHPTLHDTKWSDESDVSRLFMRRIDEFIAPGLYDILISNWQLESEVEGTTCLNISQKILLNLVRIAVIAVHLNGILMMQHTQFKSMIISLK